MAKRRRISRYQLTTAAVIAAVFIGTFVAVFFIPPEDARLRSEDGRVTVDGVAAAGAELQIVPIEEVVPQPPVLGDVYEITLDGSALTSNFTISMNYEDRRAAIAGIGSESALKAMVYDPRVLAWRFVPSVVDYTQGELVVDVPAGTSGVLWSYGFLSEGMLPENEKVLLDELISFPPEGAVGYTVVSSFGSEEIDYLLLDAERDRGGCAGVYETGDQTTITSKEEIQGGSMYRLMAFWEIAEGCDEGERITSEKDSSTE